MNALRFDVQFEDLPGFRADAVLDDAVFEVLVEPRDLRRVRAALMEVARYCERQGDRRGILILDEPQIGGTRLSEEWEGIRGIFRSEILQRLVIILHREKALDTVLGELTTQERNSVRAVVDHARVQSFRTSQRAPDAFSDLLRILINQWFRQAGPMTSRWLAEAAGCSYPTVAAALARVEKYLTRHSDRRVELKAFPKDEWFRLVANADRVRQTQLFADHSGQPRPMESLVARFERLNLKHVAMGGVLGARHRFSKLDLAGTPRLDLTIHAHERPLDLGFLRQLDPALKPARPGEPARLVLHTLRSPHTFFAETPEGRVWADPVECLLDLHEMRLESQAVEFQKFLILGSR